MVQVVKRLLTKLKALIKNPKTAKKKKKKKGLDLVSCGEVFIG
jgi:hypothetical protein